ncbi:MAG: methionine synthase, partial [Oscillospiraceae bacterium]|nr:methionine synthase [Oscillospiraceae bacterium]
MISLSSVDRNQAFRYMGLHDKPDNKMLEMADYAEKELLRCIQPRYCWKVFQKQHLEKILIGSDIQKHLENCESVILFCATLSQKTDACIRFAQVVDVLAGMMTDAMASAMTEKLCDEAEKEILNNFPDMFSTWRFSPGYGDMPLSVQQDFLNLINAEKQLGICVSEGGLLIPTKSVTAIIGLSEKPLPKAKKGCAVCNLSKSCPYRVKGVHCT